MHSYLIFDEIQSMKRLLNDYKLQNKSCNLKFLLLVSWWHHVSPLHQIKDLNLFFKLSLHGFASNLHSKLVLYHYAFCVNMKQINAGKLQKNRFKSPFMWCRGPIFLGNGRNPGKFWTLACFSQYLPNSYIKSEARTEFSGLFYIYSKNFQLSNWSPSWPILITYKVGVMGPDVSPCHPGPMTAHSLISTLTLSTFNLISINYDNLWLHILNVVEGLMWIGKNSLNNFICHHRYRILLFTY